MDVKVQALTERLKEILRAKVDDPFDRGDNATETLTTGNNKLALSNKNLKNVNQALGVTTGNEYYRFRDFSISFDDPSNKSEYPEITFDTAPSENVAVDYHYNSSFIYPTYPTDQIQKALITLHHISSSELPNFIGRNKTPAVKNKRYQSSFQIDVWVEDGVSVTDPGSKTGFYSGGKLSDYLADEVLKAFQENMDHLEEQGIKDVELTVARTADWQGEVKNHRKVMNFQFTHSQEF